MPSGCFLFGNNHIFPEVRRIKYVLKVFGVNRNLYLQQLCNLTLGKSDCFAFDSYTDRCFSLKFRNTNAVVNICEDVQPILG